jgi:hypothetical protein
VPLGVLEECTPHFPCWFHYRGQREQNNGFKRMILNLLQLHEGVDFKAFLYSVRIGISNHRTVRTVARKAVESRMTEMTELTDRIPVLPKYARHSRRASTCPLTYLINIEPTPQEPNSRHILFYPAPSPFPLYP